MALVAQSKLAVLEGDLEKAGRILDEILEKYGEKRQERDFLPHISAVSVIARRLNVAERLIAERLAPGWRVEVRLTPPIKNLGAAVRWILSDDKTMTFEINEDVFASDHTEYYVQSWIYCLPLYAAYTHDPDIQLGRVDINLDDRAALPGLVGCEVRRDCFLIPDRVFFHLDGYRDTARQYRQDDVPWDERQPIALWRGSTTGIPEDRTVGWRSLPRIRLCQIARSPSSRAMIDAGITAITQIADPGAADELREAGLMAPHLAAGQFNRYKYQIDIDGNTNSWPGLFYKLLTGSPVLKIASPQGYRQWYYDQLRPWINFVPVTSDMSDLVETLDWLRAHDDAARRIGERGRALADSLDFEGELRRAGRVITAAIRYFAQQPETSLSFGLGAAANTCLREGWDEPGDNGVPMLGAESRIELPRPVAMGDFVLMLNISPFTDAPGSPRQQVTVIGVNGEVVHQAELSTRQVLCCPLPERTFRTAETLRLTLLHPDAVPAASAEKPLDERLLTCILHAIDLVPSDVHGTRVRSSAPVDESAMDELTARFYTVSPYEGFDPSLHPDDLQGWNSADPLFDEVIKKLSPRIIVEVGSWKGTSAIHLAKIIKSLGLPTKIICIDTWLGSPEHFLGDRPEWRESLRQEHGYPRLYYTFLANVVRQGMQDVIIPLPTTSESGAFILSRKQVRPDLVYIDGAHEHDSVLRDLRVYWRILADKGIILGDDYAGWARGVTQAANEFSAEIGYPIFGKSGKFVLSKDKSRPIQITIG